jgi:hypothetical protein
VSAALEEFLVDEPIGAAEFNRLAGRYGVQVLNAGQVDGWPIWRPTCRWPGCGWAGETVEVFGEAAAEAGTHVHLPTQRGSS